MKTKKELNTLKKGEAAMKTKEELNTLKEEVETMSKKLHELTDEELAQVVGGFEPGSSAQIRRPTYATDY